MWRKVLIFISFARMIPYFCEWDGVVDGVGVGERRRGGRRRLVNYEAFFVY